jgi:hypothetical protein
MDPRGQVGQDIQPCSRSKPTDAGCKGERVNVLFFSNTLSNYVYSVNAKMLNASGTKI